MNSGEAPVYTADVPHARGRAVEKSTKTAAWRTNPEENRDGRGERHFNASHNIYNPKEFDTTQPALLRPAVLVAPLHRAIMMVTILEARG